MEVRYKLRAIPVKLEEMELVKIEMEGVIQELSRHKVSRMENIWCL